MDPMRMTLADARAMLEEHFGASSVPAKHLRLLDWWQRLLADPDAPVHWQRACERDLAETFGRIAEREVVWVMRV